MIETLAAFHFLRPFWLLALPVIVLGWWLARPRKPADAAQAADLAPHLAAALRVGTSGTARVFPVDGLCAGLVLLALAASGPAWSRIPNPLVAETAPLVVALEVTETMQTPDLAPTRADRARFKILDLIAARAGARTALVAYAGTAHRVAPLTEDPDILRPLLEGLSPSVMPVAGDDAAAALDLAVEIHATADTPGAILFVLDDLDPGAIAAFEAERDPPLPPVVILVALPGGQVPAQLELVSTATVVPMSADDSDLNRIESRLRSVHRAALLADERLDWDDRGWWLLWPAAALLLLSFRRGWALRWAPALALAFGLQAPGMARADGWVDWFLTPNQQGMLAYRNKDFARAGELFQDPMWQGHAKLRAGQYEEAAEIFAGLDGAEAAFAEGMARLRNREYRAGARAFETALVRRPDFPEAETNRDIAWAMVDYVETAREQSDTGEDSGIGADDVVFDNEASRGAETQIEAGDSDAAPVTADQWIDSIDTDMSDFLKARFTLENAERGQ